MRLQCLALLRGVGVHKRTRRVALPRPSGAPPGRLSTVALPGAGSAHAAIEPFAGEVQRTGIMHPNIAASDLLGYAAAGLVLITFLAQSITTLRAIAIASNVMFIAYALAAWLPPVLVLHALLLPLNAWRLWQASRQQPRESERFEPGWSAPPVASFRAGLPPLAPAVPTRHSGPSAP